MVSMRTTEIDLDVHKAIEQARVDFNEPDNDVLRRLLGIDPSSGSATKPAGRSWTGKGVTLPHGTELQMEYNGQTHHGVIDNGRWLVEGKEHHSPSAAASGTARTKAGHHPSLDGWHYWRVRLPGKKTWVVLDTLRS